jgi:hypothetical protein
MATISGYVKNVTREERKTGEPYRLLHLTKTANTDDTQITKIYDWDDLAGQVSQGTWQELEIDERPATNGGLFRSLKGILDAPPSDALPSDAPPLQEPPPELEESYSPPQERPAGSFNGMAFGNARATHATLLAAWLMSHNGRMWTPAERADVWGEQLEGERHLYEIRPE